LASCSNTTASHTLTSNSQQDDTIGCCVILFCCPKGLVAKQLNMGMIGFDTVMMSERSGSRMHSYLVNALCKTIGANTKRADFALAA
jgi:hypothetical protein